MKRLSFLSGSFTGSSFNWSIVEKEAFAVVESMVRLDHFTASGEVSFFTDHANLTYIFDPYGNNPSIGRHTGSKLMRWALKLSAYRYIIEHLPGERNVWADMLTRWAVKPRSSDRAGKLASIMYAPITPSASDELDWPERSSLMKSQADSEETYGKRFKMKDGLIQDSSGIVWVPNDNDMLKLRILIAAPAGISGHRGIKVTGTTVMNHFFWKGMKEDISTFYKSYLHCLCTAAGDVVPRPLGHSMHADKPNQFFTLTSSIYRKAGQETPMYLC